MVETVLMVGIGLLVAIPCLLLLVVGGHRGGGAQPIGRVSDTPPRPMPPPRRMTGLIPGRPGQEVNSGGDTIIPPLRPDPPRPEDCGSWELLPGYPPDRSR